MGNDRSAAGGSAVTVVELAGDVAVGEPMETVGQDALLRQLMRQAIKSCKLGLHRVKGGVEAAYLHGAGQKAVGQVDEFQVYRLMNWGERLELAQGIECAL